MELGSHRPKLKLDREMIRELLDEIKGVHTRATTPGDDDRTSLQDGREAPRPVNIGDLNRMSNAIVQGIGRRDTATTGGKSGGHSTRTPVLLSSSRRGSSRARGRGERPRLRRRRRHSRTPGRRDRRACGQQELKSGTAGRARVWRMQAPEGHLSPGPDLTWPERTTSELGTSKTSRPRTRNRRRADERGARTGRAGASE